MVKGGSSSWLVPRLARGLLERRCGGRRFNARRENSFRGETCERRRRFARGDARLDGRPAITKHAACRERVARAEGARSPATCSQRQARARRRHRERACVEGQGDELRHLARAARHSTRGRRDQGARTAVRLERHERDSRDRSDRRSRDLGVRDRGDADATRRRARDAPAPRYCTLTCRPYWNVGVRKVAFTTTKYVPAARPETCAYEQ